MGNTMQPTIRFRWKTQSFALDSASQYVKFYQHVKAHLQRIFCQRFEIHLHFLMLPVNFKYYLTDF